MGVIIGLIVVGLLFLCVSDVFVSGAKAIKSKESKDDNNSNKEMNKTIYIAGENESSGKIKLDGEVLVVDDYNVINKKMTEDNHILSVSKKEYNIDLINNDLAYIRFNRGKIDILYPLTESENKGLSETFLVTKRMDYVWFDDIHNIMCIPFFSGVYKKYKKEKNKYFRYKDIISAEIHEDDKIISTTKGGLGNAIIGDALFGGVGAVVGGITAKRTTESNTLTKYTIVININDMDNPCEFIDCEYHMEVANRIFARINLICNNNNKGV